MRDQTNHGAHAATVAAWVFQRNWKFNEDACTFEQCDQQTAFDADAPVIVSDGDVRVLSGGKARHWLSGEPLTMAGVQFGREVYE